MIILKQGIIIMVVFTSLFSCKKEKSTQDSLLGYVYLYDSTGVKNNDNSGINVSIEGTTISTTTGVDGKWQLPNLAIGTYTFVFSKANYNSIRYENKQYSGSGQSFGLTCLYPIMIPSYTITTISDSTTATSFYFYGEFSGTLATQCNYRLFFGYKPNVSSNPENYFYSFSSHMTKEKPLVRFEMAMSNFLKNIMYIDNLSIGDTVYLVAYTESLITTASGTTLPSISYIDSKTGRNIYPYLNPTPSNVVKVIVR